MENRIIENQFRADEIVNIQQWDSYTQSMVTRAFSKLCGRLRLAHEDNQNLSITTEVKSYDGKVAVVTATCITEKGSFTGTGMASLERDHSVAPAILEVAESRAIARALRFAGYGLEYCSAEEVSHLGNGNSQEKGTEPQHEPHPQPANTNPAPPTNVGAPFTKEAQFTGSSSGKISQWQRRYLLTLCRKHGKSMAELEQQSLEAFGATIQELTRVSASTLIQSLLPH